MVAARFRLLVLGATLALAALGGSALAYVCHPAAKGTRTLTLRGEVRSAALRGRDVELLVAGRAGCTRISWSTQTGRTDRGASACAVRSTVSARVRGATVRVDSRGRPLLELGGRALPLPAQPRSGSLAVAGGIAVFSAVHGQGLFAVRVSDGAFTFLGPDGGAFPALVSARGVVFHDGESKRALREGRTIVRFVPRAAIEAGFMQTTAPVLTRGPIRALSFDGPRVALAVGDPRGVCGRILYWNVAWQPVQQISAPSGVTCLPGVRGIGISSVAIGGFRAEWVATAHGSARLIAGSPKCQEWVVRRLAQGPGGEQIVALAGDGATVAYAATTHEQGLRGMTSVGVVGGDWRARQITSGLGAPLALTAGQNRVAVLWPSGRLELRGGGGRLLASFHVGAARSLSLHGTTLAALRRGRLDLYDVGTGARTRSLRVPGSATTVDLQFGVAALAAGRSAVVVDTRSGRVAVVGSGPRRLVGVQIEGPGLAYAWTDARTGVARFVPWTGIDAALGES